MMRGGFDGWRATRSRVKNMRKGSLIITMIITILTSALVFIFFSKDEKLGYSKVENTTLYEYFLERTDTREGFLSKNGNIRVFCVSPYSLVSSYSIIGPQYRVPREIREEVAGGVYYAILIFDLAGELISEVKAGEAYGYYAAQEKCNNKSE